MSKFVNQSGWKRYLLWFAHEHVEFRKEEINSLLSMFNIKMQFVSKPVDVEPFWIVEFPNENDAKLLTSRSVSLRSCIELYSHSKTIMKLHETLKLFPVEAMNSYLGEATSFKIDVETFCKHFSQKEKIEKLEAFEYLPFKGPVRLKNPDVTFSYIEYYGTDPKCPPDEPYDVFFGRLVTSGLRNLIKTLSLKTRKFIGNTSMDPQLSLLMANQAKVQPGDLVLDPFVGTGSLLVAAAQFGGHVVGTDIDFLMLHARTRPSRITQQKREKDESVKSNMQQYNLESKYVDVLVNDFAMVFWRDGIVFDSIITDPPYGIREATERIGTLKENYTIAERHLKSHIPAKIEYGISKLFKDLLHFSAKHLKMNGRLVCWFPVFREDYCEKGLPQHQCLKLIANSEQVLNTHTSRRLLTYEKCQEFNERMHEDFLKEEEEINNIQDFRTKYYETREETRKERRMRQAELRLHGKLQYEQRLQREKGDSSGVIDGNWENQQSSGRNTDIAGNNDKNVV